MPSTYSSNLGFELPAAGEQSGQWGTTVNNNVGTLIEQAISGRANVLMDDGADTTITMPDGATGVARNIMLRLYGSLSAERNLVVPTKTKLYLIFNTCNYPIVVKTNGGVGVTIPVDKAVWVFCDGATGVYNGPSYLIGDISGNAATATTATTATTAGTCTGNAATATYATTAGNAATVTNGVYTSQFYPNPTWLTSLDPTKLSSNVPVTKGGTGANDATAARANLGVPSTTGTGATGSWNISITGNAATATSAGTSGSFTASLRRDTTSGSVLQTGTAYWQRVGKVVNVRLPNNMWAFTDALQLFITGLPSEIVPTGLAASALQQLQLVPLVDGGNNSYGSIQSLEDNSHYSFSGYSFAVGSSNKGLSGSVTFTYFMAD